jgi:hypothetical protein
MLQAPRSLLVTDDTGSHPRRGQVGLVGLAIIGLISPGFPGAAIHQGKQLRTGVHNAGGDLYLHNKLRIGVLHLMGFIAIERLFLLLQPKRVRVRLVPDDIMIVAVAPLTLMIFLHAKQVHPGDDIGGVGEVDEVGNQATAMGSTLSH